MPLSRKLVLSIASLTVLVLAGVGAARYFSSSSSSAPAADSPAALSTEQPALTVQVVSPEMASLPVRIAANGNIVAWQEASLGAEVDGLRLVSVPVDVGDVVRRGQLLASFAPETVAAELAQRRAEVTQAEVALTEAAANARRARALEESGAMSLQQIQQQIAAEQGAQARLDAARAQAALQALKLGQTRLLAPDDGVISARLAAVGSVVPAGQELFRLIRQGRLEWRAEVPAAALSRLRVGQPVSITLAGSEVVPGRVRMLAPLVETQTRNGLVHVEVLRNGAARAGMYARGEFDLGSSAALTLPSTAVQMREGFHQVMRVDAQQRIQQTRVRVGRPSGDRIEIVEGLQLQDRVVAAGGAFLGQNDLVRVVPGTPAASGPAPHVASLQR